MAVLRERPYAQFNFLVDLGTGATDGPQAGFQECGQIGMSVDVIEYRNGNEKENESRKLTGLARVSDVTLKRGHHRFARPLRLDQRHPERRPERGSATSRSSCKTKTTRPSCMTWKLFRARTVKHVSGPFNAQACDVAMEELTLAYERLEME